MDKSNAQLVQARGYVTKLREFVDLVDLIDEREFTAEETVSFLREVVEYLLKYGKIDQFGPDQLESHVRQVFDRTDVFRFEDEALKKTRIVSLGKKPFSYKHEKELYERRAILFFTAKKDIITAEFIPSERPFVQVFAANNSYLCGLFANGINESYEERLADLLLSLSHQLENCQEKMMDRFNAMSHNRFVLDVLRGFAELQVT